jgi:hypothetical protein
MKTLRVGVDFDGVVAYNPLRLARSTIKYFKKEVLGVHKLTFFRPKNNFEKLLWIVLHESSVLPADGIELLKKMSKNRNMEFFLITGRYGVLKNSLMKWLKRHQLTEVFKSIYVNENEEQPHLFKKRILEELQIDCYIEDNLDIVEFLTKNSKCDIFWVYNLMDRHVEYLQKVPSLRHALERIGNKK